MIKILNIHTIQNQIVNLSILFSTLMQNNVILFVQLVYSCLGGVTIVFNNSDLNSLITFDATTGKIHLKDQRMILVGTDAIGTLRRDLIRSVGMDQAKKILLRYGRNFGVEFAKNLKALFSFESPFEWFHAGPQMSRITGAYFSQNTQIIYNHNTGEYFAEGYWHHSYEAEQHLKHFGVPFVIH